MSDYLDRLSDDELKRRIAQHEHALDELYRERYRRLGVGGAINIQFHIQPMHSIEDVKKLRKLINELNEHVPP